MMRNVSVRIDEELLMEIRKIAERDYRSLSKQIVIAIREYVDADQNKQSKGKNLYYRV